MGQRTVSITILVVAALAGLASTRQQSVALRQVEPPSASVTEPFGLIFGLRELAGSRLLVNDGAKKRLLLFEPDLKRYSTIADTSGTAAANYGCCAAQLISYLGDSVLLPNFESRGLLLVDPNGKVIRVMAVPKAGDYRFISGSRAMIDAKGRLIYRGAYPPTRGAPVPVGETIITQAADSAPLVRADFDSRTVDTIATVKIPSLQKTYRSSRSAPGVSIRTVINPLGLADDWAVASDGSVAVVRAHDYHVEWLTADGARVIASKMPFDWLRVSDEEKKRLADSARAASQKTIDDAKARDAAAPPRALPPGAISSSRSIGTINTLDGTSTSIAFDAVIEAAPINEILDYYPPLRAGAVQPDRDGNLWILPTTSARPVKGGIVYDVVNRKGELVERVQMPVERSVAGFGPKGVVYMMWRSPADSLWRIEKTRVKR